ncbi:MAG: hypothetical protein HYV27_14525 [Candidatus Hydrogenedentes bacterium]|nr:hypothetical protein [Candidatus Hydrogenedentota bacterium]
MTALFAGSGLGFATGVSAAGSTTLLIGTVLAGIFFFSTTFDFATTFFFSFTIFVLSGRLGFAGFLGALFLEAALGTALALGFGLAALALGFAFGFDFGAGFALDFGFALGAALGLAPDFALATGFFALFTTFFATIIASRPSAGTSPEGGGATQKQLASGRKQNPCLQNLILQHRNRPSPERGRQKLIFWMRFGNLNACYQARYEKRDAGENARSVRTVGNSIQQHRAMQQGEWRRGSDC